MTVANRYRGKDLYVDFICPAGTIILTGDQTKFDISRSCDMLDASAGNTLDKEYIAGLKDGTASLSLFDTGLAGTAVAAALEEGTYGTLRYGPLGNTTGKPKGGITAFVKTHKFSEAINTPTTLDAEFQKSGPMLFDYGAVWP